LSAGSIVHRQLVAIADRRIHYRIDMLTGLIGMSQAKCVS